MKYTHTQSISPALIVLIAVCPSFVVNCCFRIFIGGSQRVAVLYRKNKYKQNPYDLLTAYMNKTAINPHCMHSRMSPRAITPKLGESLIPAMAVLGRYTTSSANLIMKLIPHAYNGSQRAIDHILYSTCQSQWQSIVSA